MQKTDACMCVGKFDQDIDTVEQQIELPELRALDYFMNLFQVEIHLSSFSASSARKPNCVFSWLVLSLLAIATLFAVFIYLFGSFSNWRNLSLPEILLVPYYLLL